MPNFLFGFDGPNGAGKTTIIHAVSDILRSLPQLEDWDVRVVKFPGETDVGRKIRDILLHGYEIPPAVETLLFTADNALTFQLIDATPDAKIIWLTDRTWLSSVVYQGVRGMTRAEITRLQTAHMKTPYDQVYFFDVPADILKARMVERGDPLDRIENFEHLMGTQIQLAWQQMFRAFIKGTVIDGSRDKGTIVSEIVTDILKCVS
jgi:dTMP kinase